MLFGTPVDHPARRQLRAEAVHLDEEREARRRSRTVPPRPAA
jgi:hypothetical protein